MNQIIAWAYMVETESGLTKDQISTLMEYIPSDVEVILFGNDVPDELGKKLLEANSIAYGFIDNDHFDDTFEIQKTLAAVCNDWDKERKDRTYTTENGLRVMMFCDVETVK